MAGSAGTQFHFAIDIEPEPVFAPETRTLVQQRLLWAGFEAGFKLHLANAVLRPTCVGRKNFQAGPDGDLSLLGEQLGLTGLAFLRSLGVDQIIDGTQGKGAVARAHQGFCRGRRAGALQGRFTALTEHLAGTAGAGFVAAQLVVVHASNPFQC